MEVFRLKFCKDLTKLCIFITVSDYDLLTKKLARNQMPMF